MKLLGGGGGAVKIVCDRPTLALSSALVPQILSVPRATLRRGTSIPKRPQKDANRRGKTQKYAKKDPERHKKTTKYDKKTFKIILYYVFNIKESKKRVQIQRKI